MLVPIMVHFQIMVGRGIQMRIRSSDSEAGRREESIQARAP